jgi:hypothetical protein
MCRELGNAIKVSLHQSGSLRLAFDSDFYEAQFPSASRREGGRLLESWMAVSLPGGAQLALRIITPKGSVATVDSDLAGIIQVAAPMDGNAIEFYVIFTTTPRMEGEWPGKHKSGSSLVGSYELPDGRRVWVVSREIPLPALTVEAGAPHFFHGKSELDLKSDDLRFVAIADSPDGTKVLLDGKIERSQRAA